MLILKYRVTFWSVAREWVWNISDKKVAKGEGLQIKLILRWYLFWIAPKTFRGRPLCLLNALCSFDFCRVSRVRSVRYYKFRSAVGVVILSRTYFHKIPLYISLDSNTGMRSLLTGDMFHRICTDLVNKDCYLKW